MKKRNTWVVDHQSLLMRKCAMDHIAETATCLIRRISGLIIIGVVWTPGP